jgi:subtilase family serine protease
VGGGPTGRSRFGAARAPSRPGTARAERRSHDPEVTMRRSLVLSLLLVAGCAGGATEPADVVEESLGAHAAVCPGPAAAGDAHCHARVRVAPDGTPAAAAAPAGFGPADLQSAYATPSASGGSGQLVAIVDAYDNPNAESDLAVYRRQFGLPACTSATGCFRKVNQNGVAGSYPRGDVGWGQEIDLDIEMVSALCPNCRILLVEASSSSLTDLGAAVNTAVALGATVVSNSYGGSESSGEVASEQTYYNHPGVAITVSSGDGGFGVEFPAASRFVTAVGGTHLVRAANARGWAETAWSGAGSGCSAFIAKPAWQTDAGCARRTVADVAAVADPNTGVAVYDSYGHGSRSVGWLVFGGTSVAAPLVGAVYALAGNGGGGAGASYAYGHAQGLADVVAGSNGTCTTPYLCTAGVGYDGPTGLGTPIGITAF